ncbi:nucleoside hydrolase [Paenibacillus sp. FSL H8-0034]|uniref:nucleoside hydrolase n=1 Tax=Paenibacillus sp. FSL H8-0034 TaxID=2954671 RepID=UPI0030FA55F2
MALTTEQLINRLKVPTSRIRAVLDTDTFNEIDDQFAVVYSLMSKEKLQMEAFYAAPFYNELSNGPKDGMEKSFDELQRILEIMGVRESIPSYRGSEAYLPDPSTPVKSEAARNLVERAMASTADDPLYVISIGAITNVASALLMEPEIIDKIVVVWLGGHALHWKDTKEFNLKQDLHASRIVFDSGVPLVLIPCKGVASHLSTSLSEIRDYVKGSGLIGEYLYETYKNCREDHYAYSRVIWDISAIAYLVQSDWLPSTLVHSPLISEDFRWSFDSNRHFIRYVHDLKRDDIFKDLFTKMRLAASK